MMLTITISLRALLTVLGTIFDILQDPIFWAGIGLIVMARKWKRVANHRVLFGRLGLGLACLAVATNIGRNVASFVREAN